MELTLEKLKNLQPGEIFATGVAENSPDGVYMVDIHLGRKLCWVAKRGGIHDWAIYVHWADKGGIQFVAKHGDKITDSNVIKRLVPCDDEAFNMYRF